LKGEPFLDYAFVPGLTDYELLLRRVMQARPKTTLIAKFGLTSIAGFLQELSSQSVKADDLVVGAHASDNTWAIPFDSTTPRPTGSNGKDYEILEAVKLKGTIHIPASVRSASTKFHVKGCDIGSDRAQPFVTLLKEALDNPQQVTAPKYLHTLAPHADRGVFEYMQYEFIVMSKTYIENTPALVESFQKQGFTTGVEAGKPTVPIPDDNWKKWVKYGLNLAPWDSDEVVFTVETKIDPPITSGKVKLTYLFKNASCTSRLETFGINAPMGSTPIPKDDATRLALAKDRLRAMPTMQSSHPFATYVRLGFQDFDSFFDGLDWTVVVQGTDLVITGQHYVYSVRIPITKAADNKLIFNYYPLAGKPAINFAEDNAVFVLFGLT